MRRCGDACPPYNPSDPREQSWPDPTLARPKFCPDLPWLGSALNAVSTAAAADVDLLEGAKNGLGLLIDRWAVNGRDGPGWLAIHRLAAKTAWRQWLVCRAVVVVDAAFHRLCIRQLAASWRL